MGSQARAMLKSSDLNATDVLEVEFACGPEASFGELGLKPQSLLLPPALFEQIRA